VTARLAAERTIVATVIPLVVEAGAIAPEDRWTRHVAQLEPQREPGVNADRGV
jgi:hypothetical protein